MKCLRHAILSYVLYSMGPLTHLKQEGKQFLKQLSDYRHEITNVFYVTKKKGLIITRRQQNLFRIHW